MPFARTASHAFTAAVVLACGLFASCATPAGPRPANASAVSPADPTVSPYKSLRKGMRAAEVRQLLGEPAEIKPMVAGTVAGDVWVYRKTYMGAARQVAAEMIDVPFTDPIDGTTRMIKEPLYKTEITNVEETTELLMLKDQLIEWKQSRLSDRQYH